MTNNTKELLPCPFCGSKAVLSYKHYFSIECTNGECNICMNRVSKTILIKAWNTRHLASMGDGWLPISIKPSEDGDYLVYMPSRSLDGFSVQDYSTSDDQFSNDYGITHYMKLPQPPEAK